jgi:hypothetical protein
MFIRTSTNKMMPSQTVTTFSRLRFNNFAASSSGNGPVEILLSDATFSKTVHVGECEMSRNVTYPRCAPAAFATALSCGSDPGPAVIDLRGTPFAVADGPAQWESCGIATENGTCAFGKSANVTCTHGGQRCELKCSGACETCAPKVTLGCGNDDPACDPEGYPVTSGAVLRLVVYDEKLLFAPGCPPRPPAGPKPRSPYQRYWLVVVLVCVLLLLLLLLVLVLHRRYRKRISFLGHRQPLAGAEAQPPIPSATTPLDQVRAASIGPWHGFQSRVSLVRAQETSCMTNSWGHSLMGCIST